MATLAEIRAKLAEQESRASGTGGGDNAVYPFWNMQEGDTVVARFLPDADDSNPFFWKERLMIKLPFAGVKGDPNSRPVIVQVPCNEMYEGVGSCPILAQVRPWFQDKSLEDLGRKYWKKRSYVFQGFVCENPLEDESPENPIRRYVIGPQLYELIKQSLMDPDMEEMPTDYTEGLDFRIKKTSKGGYADYGTSTWSRKSRPLHDDEMHAINTHGLFNLADFLPKKPSQEELNVMTEMFEASVDGELYDPEKWSRFYRPNGVNVAPTGDPVPPPSTTPEPKDTVATAPVESVKEEVADTASDNDTSGGAADAQNILAMIRSRQS